MEDLPRFPLGPAGLLPACQGKKFGVPSGGMVLSPSGMTDRLCTAPWVGRRALLLRKSCRKAKLGIPCTVKGVWWNHFLAHILFEKIGRSFHFKKFISWLEDPDLFTLRTPVLVVLYPHEGSERERERSPTPTRREAAPHFYPSEPSPEETGALLGENKSNSCRTSGRNW